jgi:hypothetical protein
METQSLELSKPEPSDQQLSLPDSGPDPVMRLIQKVVDGGVSEANVNALDKLLDVYERLDEKRAERAFNAAFVALQSDLPTIVASSIIPNRGKYERFEDVCKVVNPLLAKHGFSVSFSMDFKENRIVETCHLRHVGGHSQSNSFAVRTGGKADSDTQADCKAATTAKRNALLNCLNIVIRQDALLNEDQDASLEGATISPDKVAYLREQVAETNSDPVKFLALAGVSKFEDIRTGSYDVLVRALAAKSRRA